MFTTLALMLSFALWKISMSVLLLLIYGFIFILAVFFSMREVGFMKLEFTPSRFKFWGLVALVLSIPYWNWLYDSKLTYDVTRPIVRSWDEHVEQAKPEVPVTRTDIGSEIRRYELVDWNPPKHFYVTLEDVQTHEVFKSVYVSKHCNAYTSLKRGEEYNITITKYTLSDRPGVVFTEFSNLYSTFCS